MQQTTKQSIQHIWCLIPLERNLDFGCNEESIARETAEAQGSADEDGKEAVDIKSPASSPVSTTELWDSSKDFDHLAFALFSTKSFADSLDTTLKTGQQFHRLHSKPFTI